MTTKEEITVPVQIGLNEISSLMRVVSIAEQKNEQITASKLANDISYVSTANAILDVKDIITSARREYKWSTFS